MNSQLSFYAAKHAGIVYVSLAYFVVATMLSSLITKALKHMKEYTKSPTVYVVMSLSLISLSAYYSRLVVKNLPFIMDGLGGYDHSKLKEINGGVVLAFSLYSIQSGLGEKLREISWLKNKDKSD